MNTVKFFVVMLAVGAFVASCSQPPAANTKPTPASNAATSVNANHTTVDVTTSNNISNVGKAMPSNNPASALRAAGREEPLEGPQGNLYTEKCMICHKDTGKGGKMTLEGKSINPIDLTSAKVKARSDDKLLAEIKEGVPDEGMPSFNGKLSDDEIKTIVSYIRTLK